MKKITALLLVLALILSLGACSKAPAEEATDAPTNAATDPATDAPTGGDTNPASYEWPMVGSVENVKIVEQEPEKPLRFAFLGYSNNSYWDLIYQGVDGAAEFLGLHNVTIEKINLGTAIGAGFYTGGTVCYAFILLAMNVLRLVDVRIQSRQKTATVYFELRSKLSIGQLVRLAREKDCTLSELELYADSGYGDNLVCGTFTLWAEGRTSLDDILRELSAVEGVIYLTRI